MKLIRFGEIGHEKPGVQLPDGTRLDASSLGEDYNETFFETGGLERLSQWLLEKADSAPRVPNHVRLGCPVGRPSKIICVGLNYRDHAQETGADIPTEPVIFYKATTAICGPNDTVIIPKNSEKTDWEVELALVIGKKTRYVEEADALDYIAGYMLHNDFTERAFQFERGGQWLKGKCSDTFAPMGPFLATRNEIPDPHNLPMWLTVNGKMMQNSHTSNLIFGVPFLVSYISQFMTLLPGDIISTGTPGGVGFGQKPPVYLRPGDIVELGVEGLGTSRQVMQAYAFSAE